jgi:hypothetical protein
VLDRLVCIGGWVWRSDLGGMPLAVQRLRLSGTDQAIYTLRREDGLLHAMHRSLVRGGRGVGANVIPQP